MRAVWLRRFGGPEVLTAEDTPDPVPGEGQVVVEAAAIGITYVETQVRSGSAPCRCPSSRSSPATASRARSWRPGRAWTPR